MIAPIVIRAAPSSGGTDELEVDVETPENPCHNQVAEKSVTNPETSEA